MFTCREVTSDTSVVDAASTMLQQHISGLPVVNEAGTPSRSEGAPALPPGSSRPSSAHFPRCWLTLSQHNRCVSFHN
ncbi:CBS domain-containing protein (plasmid) [Nitrobacter sp. NHB1]|uniref:CBS domain-containing protein n=1 Tax=Nitrobacter sp. NHB1 TaxID=3119830 RepID=UPI002FFFCBBA